MKKATFPAILSTFILCMIVWLIVTWPFGSAVRAMLEELIAGAVFSLFVALFSARFLIKESSFWLWNPKRFFTLLAYCTVIFPVELIKANLSMARIVLSPKMPINPGIVKVPVGLRSNYGQAMLANSITLTPGTITLETQDTPEENYFYIHWIDVTEPDRVKAGDAIKGGMEKWVRRIWK